MTVISKTIIINTRAAYAKPILGRKSCTKIVYSISTSLNTLIHRVFFRSKRLPTYLFLFSNNILIRQFITFSCTFKRLIFRLALFHARIFLHTRENTIHPAVIGVIIQTSNTGFHPCVYAYFSLNQLTVTKFK